MKFNKYKTKYKHGFTSAEIKDLLKNYTDIDTEKFNDALMGITCMSINNEIVIYHHDVEKALRCGMEKRNLKHIEWD